MHLIQNDIRNKLFSQIECLWYIFYYKSTVFHSVDKVIWNIDIFPKATIFYDEIVIFSYSGPQES